MVNALTHIKNFAQSAVENIPNSYVPVHDLEDEIATMSANSTWAAAISLIVLVIIAAITKDRFPKFKLPLFIMISFVMASSFLFLAGATIYLNVKSDTGGPVHWHADIEFWACGNELELRDPYEFLSNKIGTATLHEHDDHRIHLEGVPVEVENDASLGKFMYVIGGAITKDAVVVPLNPPEVGGYFENDIDGDGPPDLYGSLIDPYIVQDEIGPAARFFSGETCGDEVAEVQVFRYRVNQGEDTYYQEKLDNPRDYVIRDESVVPDGDCIIVEFGPVRDTTDKLCAQYGVLDTERCEEFGVTPEARGICTMREVPAPNASASEPIEVVEPIEETQEESEAAPTEVPEWPYSFESLRPEQFEAVKTKCDEIASDPLADASEECLAFFDYEDSLENTNQ